MSDEQMMARDDRWIDQTTFHDPADPGSGNCTEAAVASLLGLPLDAVPRFRGAGPEAHDFWDAFKRFFAERGLEVVRFNGELIFDSLYLASGPSARGCDHMVVMRDGNLAHDPHPSRAGLLEVKHVWALLLHDPTALLAVERRGMEAMRERAARRADEIEMSDEYALGDGPTIGGAIRALPVSGAVGDADPWAGVVAEIAAERRRQVEVEGWTPEHDDSHRAGEMAIAASCYARHAADGIGRLTYRNAPPAGPWPWGWAWWKPKDPRRDLIRAAALLVAEIERRDRAAPPRGEGE